MGGGVPASAQSAGGITEQVPETDFKSPDRLQVRRGARVGVRDAGVARDEGTDPVGDLPGSVESSGGRHVNAHDPGPGAYPTLGRKTEEASPGLVTEPEEARALTGAGQDGGDLAVLVGREIGLVVGLHQTHHLGADAIEAVQRPVTHNNGAVCRQLASEIGFGIADPAL